MPNLRQQKENRVAFDACVNETPHQLFGLNWQNKFTSSSRKWTIIYVQVSYKYIVIYKLNLQVKF